MDIQTQNQEILSVTDIAGLIQGEITTSPKYPDCRIDYAFASDLMSDVLTIDSTHVVLITGLANPQVIRTAEMSDISLIIIARDKKCSREMIDLANDCQIILIESPFSVFKISGILYQKSIQPIF